MLDKPRDSSRLGESFASCNAFIDASLEGGGQCLVHCFQGKSRSAAVRLFVSQSLSLSIFHDAQNYSIPIGRILYMIYI